jgi:putative hydrolase of the HAD superfamily
MHQAAIVGKIIRRPPEETKERLDRFVYRAWEPVFKRVKLYPDVVETLTALRKEGLKVGLLSDFPPEKKVDYLGLSGLWDAELCSEYSGVIKPHPLPFTELAAAMGLPPEKILYVGNSHPYDVIGASRAGMKTAWIKKPLIPGMKVKPLKADFVFKDYRQLHEFVLN